MWTINPKQYGKAQSGFSVPAALFIVLVLAGLGAFLATIGSSQQLGHAQDIVSSHTFQAARVGMEWGVYQVINTNGTFRNNCEGLGGSSTLNDMDGLPDIHVEISCRSLPYQEGVTKLRSYAIVSTACNSASCGAGVKPPLYVERRLETNITQAVP